MFESTRTTARRRSLAGVAAAALALVGLAVTAPSAQATLVSPADPDARITPSPVSPGATTTHTVTFEGTDSAKVQIVSVKVPSSFGSPSSASYTVPGSWTGSYNSATQTFSFSTTQANAKLGTGQTITANITTVAPTTAGNYTWTTTARSNDTGNANSVVAVNPQPVVTVANPTQTITFGALSAKTYGDTDFTVSATGGASGNPVTFTAGGDCTSGGTHGATIHLTGAGSCDVTANQAGGGGYEAAPSVTRSFEIAKANQAISFDPIGTQSYGSGPLTLSASSSSGLAVNYATQGPCSASGNSLSLTGAGDCTVTASQAGNANYNAASPQSRTFTIAKATAVLALDDLGPYTYDGAAHHASASTDPAGLDDVTVAYSRGGNPVTHPTDAGNYAVTATLDNPNYAAEQQSGTLVIEVRHLTGSFTVSGKTYDGSATASIAGCALPAGVAPGDDVSLDCSAATATFDSEDAGARTASISGAVLSGADKGNYVLDGVNNASGTIAPLQVSGSVTAADKEYDGLKAAQATGNLIAEKINSDDVTIHVLSATFDTKDIGDEKDVTVAVELAGDDADNYQLVSTTVSDKADIWAKQLVGSFTADDKVYDSTTTVVVHPLTPLAGIVGTEAVSLVVNDAAFAGASAGDDKLVSGSLSLTGADAGNYVLDPVNSSNTALADITARTVTGSFTADDKVYDGTDAATIDGRSLDPASGNTGPVPGDDVTLSGGTARFDNKDVGTGKEVTGTGFTLVGAAKNNYSLASSTLTTAADVTALDVTGSFTADDKPYDGNKTATVKNTSLPGAIEDDDIDLVVTAPEFDTKNVGTDKDVTGTLSLGGAAAGNYNLTNPGAFGTKAAITAKELTGSFTANGKVYDGNTTATVGTRSLPGVLGTEDVTLVVTDPAFEDKNVGTGKKVTGALSLGGTDKGNYLLSADSVGTTTADITALDVTGSFTANDRAYDGSMTATVKGSSLPGTIGNDDIDLVVAEPEFDTKDVGTDKDVTGTLSLNGVDAGNYHLTNPGAFDTLAAITAKQLTGSFTANNKVYDANTTATVDTRSLPGVIGDEDVTLVVTGPTFEDKNAGTGKKVTATLSLGGAAKDNYVLGNTTAETVGNITTRTVAGSFTAFNKVWDGTTVATINTRNLAAASGTTGKVTGDVVELSGGTATFADANVGTGKTVNATGFSLSGTDAANYVLAPEPWTATASITALYSGKGFFAPVDIAPAGATRIWNTIKGGQTVPLKFEVFDAAGTVEQTSLSAFGADAPTQAKAFAATPVNCTTADATSDAIEVVTTGGTSLRYDTTGGQFIQNWKTPTTVGACFAVTVKTVDGTTVGPAYFKITK